MTNCKFWRSIRDLVTRQNLLILRSTPARPPGADCALQIPIPPNNYFVILEVWPGFAPGYAVLQTAA